MTISPLTGLWPPAGDVTASLRAAHGSLLGYLASQKPHRPEHITYAEAAALDDAACLAEAIAADRVDIKTGQAQVLAALSAAEMINAVSRGA